MQFDTNKRPLWPFVTVWYVACLALLLLAWQFGFGIWERPRLLPFGSLATAFLLSAGAAALLRPALQRSKWMLAVALMTMAIFGAVFLGFILTRADYSRAVILVVFVSAFALIPAPYLIGASRLRRTLALCSLLVLGLAGTFAVRVAPRVSTHASFIKTEFYNLDLHNYSKAFPKSAVHGGALSRIGDRYLLLTGDGHLHLFDWDTGTDRLTTKMLPYRIPINGDAFSAAAGRPWADQPDTDQPKEGQRLEAGHEVLNAEWFRTYGLLVQEIGPNTRIFVSHDYWNVAQECWTERVSVLEADSAAILEGKAGPGWKTLYETTPCLPVHGEHRRHGIPFVGYFGGGRMALLDPKTILLTVGDFGFDGRASIDAHPQDPAASYGKTIAINIADGRAAMFTLGHRNSQGLYIDQAGTIWSTEHGPQGGDELNRLVRGANYGWPYATDGTDYGSFSWPLNKPEAEQKGYEPPVFAWVPSIAVSNLLSLERGLFPQWRGDLLIATLKAETLLRARIRDGHVRYLEEIFIGNKIRDLIEGHDGRLILWTDDDTLISITPKDGTTGEALFAQKCDGCHQSKDVSGNRIGPSLVGVVGRRVASLQSYPNYSQSLRRLGGTWTEERLDEFLKAPATLCPGTSMDFTGDASASERGALLSYLRGLR
jgi:cytochrome c2